MLKFDDCLKTSSFEKEENWRHYDVRVPIIAQIDRNRRQSMCCLPPLILRKQPIYVIYQENEEKNKRWYAWGTEEGGRDLHPT